MIYPKLNSVNSNIGVVALSAGLGEYTNELDKSIENIKKNDFQIIETNSVRSKTNPSSTGMIRAQELDELISNKQVDIIMNACGGDFLIDIWPYINFENIKNNPKFMIGASDATSILHIITTKLDIATMYGFNAGSFDQEQLHESQLNCLKILKGNLIEQNSFDNYQIHKDSENKKYNLTEKVFWENLTDEIDEKGRIIGGCLECLKDLIGTKYDYTNEFIEKYKDDGIIWYFDIFNSSSETVYNTMLQFESAGWFKYTKAIIVGRVKYPSSFTDLTYQEALRKSLKDKKVIYNADIGHVVPKMTIINGSIAHIVSKDGKGKIQQYLT